MRNRYFLLDDKHQLIPCDDVLVWARFCENVNERRVADVTLPNGARISTVFLGLDHRFRGEGEPLVFETMIFGGSEDGYQERYSTWEEALDGHNFAVTLASVE